jgi:monoamine oxidase
MRSVVRQISDDDEEQGRIREGYGRLVEFLVRDATSLGARLLCKSRVNVVRWEPGAVTAIADDVEFRAKAALVALPLSVLKLGAAGDGVSLEPEPSAVRRGLDALEMGQALRVVLRLRRPIGLAAELAPGSFVHGIDAEFPTLWLGPLAREAQVTLWCGGPRAMRLGELDAPAIVSAAVRSAAVGLDVTLGMLGDELVGSHVHSFGSDPFSRGAYPYALVGGDASGAFDPVSNTLFFAGDYTVPEELGTVGIAVRSGVLAARKIIEALRHSA